MSTSTMLGSQGDVHRQGPFRSREPARGGSCPPESCPCSLLLLPRVHSPGAAQKLTFPWQRGHQPGMMRCFSWTSPAEPSLREAKADAMATPSSQETLDALWGCQIRLLCSLGTEPRVQPKRDKVFEGEKPRSSWPEMRHGNQLSLRIQGAMDQLVPPRGLTTCLWCDCHGEDKTPRWGGGVTIKAGDGGRGG